ncbi:MAG TPA: shikimate dehydrogenase [Myxococcaceae bacterium]|nr:shikimate dehydrogenase [Myxococcaceae bacterium]
MAPRLVVTLPSGLDGDAARAFARRIRARGAAILELRTDLHPPASVDPAALAEHLDLLVAERGARLPAPWIAAASVVDREEAHAEGGRGRPLVSHHAARPLPTSQALALWQKLRPPPEALVKHVEPLGNPPSGTRLLATQRALQGEFGPDRVTVLATGPLALPFRAVLSRANALEYVAMSADWSSAPGQRLLDDAVREARASSPRLLRLGIVGSRIQGSRSPRIHPQPFDRIDLPEDAALGDLLDALLPFYAGLAVTSPFKRAAAEHVRSKLKAVNTLVRRPDGWEAHNTDVEGARAALEALAAKQVTLLGSGGAAVALGLAARALGVELRAVRRGELGETPVSGAVIWTWPAHLPAPAHLRFERAARVAIIAYGSPAQAIAKEISQRGGLPLRLGPRWLIAQARRQRELWESAGL